MIIASAKPERRVMTGPYQTSTALHRAMARFARELEDCEDGDQLHAFLLTETEMLSQVERDCPDWWEGETGGLLGEINKVKERIEQS